MTVMFEVPSYTHAMDGAPGALVRRAAAGDKAAWGPLVERYKSLVWSIARSYRLSGEDASDVVQTTWLRLVEHLDRIRDPDAVGFLVGDHRPQRMSGPPAPPWPPGCIAGLRA